MKKKFLLVAALCAAMNLTSFAQTNLAKGIVPEKIGTIVTGENIPETLVGLTDGLMDNILLLPEPSDAGSAIQSFSIDLGKSDELGLIKIYSDGAATKDVKISVSDDKNTWTVAVDETGLEQKTEYSFNLPKGTKGRYVKFEATEAMNWGWGVKMKEFEVYKAEAATLAQISTSVGFVKTGETTDLGIKATDQFGAEFTDDITLTTDNGTIADGKLTAAKAGACTITAVSNGKTATTTVYALDDTMAPEKPTAKAENVYSIYGSNYQSDKYVHWMTWTGTDLNMDEYTLGGEVAKAFAGGSKIAIGQKANESDAGEQWMNYDNSETKYTHLSMDVFPTKDFSGALAVESDKGNQSVNVSLVAGKWNTIELNGVPEGTLKCVSIEASNNGTFAPMLLSNIYLYKLDANAVVVSKVAGENGFYEVSGTITTDNVAELKDVEGTAFNLTGVKLGDGVTKVEFKNPNAIIQVAGTYENSTATATDDWGETKNVVVKNGAWYFPTAQLEISDKNPVYRDYFISGSNNGGYKYTRSLAAKTYSTVYLKHNASVPAGCKVYEFTTDANDANQVILKEATAINAVTPYIIYNDNDTEAELVCETTDGDVDFQAGDNTTAVGNLNVIGTFNYFNGDGATQYGIQNETGENNTLTLKKIGTEATVCPFRVYFTLADGSDAKSIKLNINGGTSAINEVNNANAQEVGNIYSIDGKLVKANATSTDNLSKGVYIINGKKFIVK